MLRPPLRAASTIALTTNSARSLPRCPRTADKASSHSRVSCGSRSCASATFITLSIAGQAQSGVNVHRAPHTAATRNAAQVISPVALADELNVGWHLNVPLTLFVLELLLLLQIPKQHSCQTTTTAAIHRHAIHFPRLCLTCRRPRRCDRTDLSEAP